jgi:hypothetical protein
MHVVYYLTSSKNTLKHPRYEYALPGTLFFPEFCLAKLFFVSITKEAGIYLSIHTLSHII